MKKIHTYPTDSNSREKEERSRPISNGMNKLDVLLTKAAGLRPLFMAHGIAGYPNVGDSKKVLKALIEGGADIVELQIPFSDPLADGPTIMEASHEAIRKGIHVADVFSLSKQLTTETDVPVVIMSYANPVFRYGIPQFVSDAASSGVSALIIPDVPFDSEEGQTLMRETEKQGLYFILVVSPGVSRQRLQTLQPFAKGFMYCTTRQGITGADSHFASDMAAYTKTIREIFSIPVALGFGIKTREDFLAASQVADIVIAGSVFVEILKKDGFSAVEVIRTAQSLTGSLGRGIV